MKTASEEVTDIIFFNKWSSQTLCAGAELGVFDFLSNQNARTASRVAEDMDLDPKLLYRLLRALASLGLLNGTTGEQFTLPERGGALAQRSHFAKLFDIHMMCWGAGQERTEEEYASLLQASGWRFEICHYPSHANMGVVEAVAA